MLQVAQINPVLIELLTEELPIKPIKEEINVKQGGKRKANLDIQT